MENQQGAIEIVPQDNILANENLAHHEGLLIEEMEPNSMLHLLRSRGVLSEAQYIQIRRESDRREKAQILIEMAKQELINRSVFWQLLVQTHCDRAINYIIRGVDGANPLNPNFSIRCVRFNFRKLLIFFKDCKTKLILFKYLRLKQIAQCPMLLEEAHLIKTGLRNRQSGCDCILEVIRQMDPRYLDQLFQRLEQGENIQQERPDIIPDINNAIQILRENREFLLQEIDPTHVSHVLLEEGTFTIDDHDAVHSETRRHNRAEVLYDIIMNDISRVYLRRFLSYLRKNNYIWTTIMNPNRLREYHAREEEGQAPGGVYHEIQVRQIGEVASDYEDVPRASGLEIIVTIPIDGDEGTIRQAVNSINRDSSFRERIAENFQMEVVNLKIGSVVMRLRSLTDEACCRLLAKNGTKLTELIEYFLHLSGLRENIIKGNVEYAFDVSGEKIGDSEHKDASVSRMTVNKHWNLLIQEVEPIAISTALLEMKMFDEETKNKETKNSIMKISKRKDRVEMILNLLSSVQRNDAYDVFIKILWEKENIDIVSLNKPSIKMHEEAEKVRLGLLSKFKDVVEEFENSLIKETLRQCSKNEESTSDFSDLRISRQERVLKFLMFIMKDDSNVLALKNVLEKRNLKELVETTKDESLFLKSSRSKQKRSNDQILYQYPYRIERIADKDEITKTMNIKDEVWNELIENVKALKEPKNILFLGCLGTGKSSCINTMITALTGKYNMYADVGAGTKHSTTRLHRIPREEYWKPVNKDDKTLNLPAFIDIIGLDAQLSSPQDEESINSTIMNLVINGKLPENCDLLDLGKNLMEGNQIKERQEEKTLVVDIIVVVLSTDHPNIPQTLIDEIYDEANVKNKQIPMFAILTKMDKCTLSKNEEEEMKIQICKSINIAADKLLLCSNYRPDQRPATETDTSLLKFLAKMCSPCLEAVTLQKLEYEESNAGISLDSAIAYLTDDRNGGVFKIVFGAIIVALVAIILNFIFVHVS